jgi:hypothetical protein
VLSGWIHWEFAEQPRLSLPATKTGFLLQNPTSRKNSRAGNAFLDDLLFVSKPGSLRN